MENNILREEFEKINGYDVYAYFQDRGMHRPEIIGFCENYVDFLENKILKKPKDYKLNEELISEMCFNEKKVMGMYRLKITDDYVMAFSLDNDMIYIGDDIEIRISETSFNRLRTIYEGLSGKELSFEPKS